MRRSLTGFLFVVCTLAIVMLGAATAWTQSMSQEKPVLYTYFRSGPSPAPCGPIIKSWKPQGLTPRINSWLMAPWLPSAVSPF